MQTPERKGHFPFAFKMAFWSVSEGVSSLTTDAWEGPDSVRKGLPEGSVEDLVRDSLSNSVRDNPRMMCSTHT